MQSTSTKNKKTALFIVNPKSGTRSKAYIPNLLNRHLDKTLFEWDVKVTQYAGEATELSEAGRNNYDLIVAVGGDGTINEVAKPLINTDTTLGIIPCGSGNGLARHLKIPRSAKKAIRLLNRGCTNKIDTVNLGEDVFFNVAGVGFDAHIAKLFAGSKKRGLFNYARIAFNEIRKFRSVDYQLIIDGKEIIEKAPFLISIANSTQYGNNAHIAPAALIADGLMDICVLRKFPAWYYPILVIHLFSGTLARSKYYECWQGREAVINFLNSNSDKQIHLDGDPYVLKDSARLSINPLSLKIACSEAF